MCSHRNPIMRFFCGAFLQKSDLLCPQAHRHFSFCELFLFVPLVSKRKSGLTVWVALLQRFCKAQTDTPLSFDTKGAKESSQRKRRLKSFARCDERQGLRSLDSRPLAWGLLWAAVRTHPFPANYNLLHVKNYDIYKNLRNTYRRRHRKRRL